MDKDKEEDVAALKVTVNELREENKSLKIELEAVKSAMLAILQNNQQQQQQPEHQKQQDSLQRVEFTVPLPDKYADSRYVSTEERTRIKFQMQSDGCRMHYTNGTPTRFDGFHRTGEKYPSEYDGLTNAHRGAFITPVPGKYRFRVKGIMAGDGYKVHWYLCCLPTEDFIYIDFEKARAIFKKNKFEDGQPISFDKGTISHSGDVEEWEEKKRIFNEKTRRHLLFTLETENSGYRQEEAYVGVNCERGLVFWVELFPIKGEFERQECQFTGQLVC